MIIGPRPTVKLVALALAIAGMSCTAEAHPQQSGRQVAEIFAGHDCCGRLEHSDIKLVGEIRSSGRVFRIYNLWFVNPQSRHGMKRIAVVEGGKFVGSYIISHKAVPAIIEDRIEFTCEDGLACNGEALVIENGKLPTQLWVDGEINQWEDTI